MIEKERIAEDVCGLWPSLTERQRSLLKSRLKVNEYKKNEVIYHNFDRPDRMYFLVNGKVKVTIGGVGGRNQIIRVIKPATTARRRQPSNPPSWLPCRWT